MSRLCSCATVVVAWVLILVPATTVNAQCGGATQAQLAQSVSLVLRSDNEASWASKRLQFTTALDNAMSANRSTNLYTFNTTAYAVSEINVAGRTDLRVYLFAVANPVGGVLSAEQLATEIRGAQLYVLVQASAYYTVDSVQVGAADGCSSSSLTVANNTEEEKFTDWTIVGVIIAVGLVIILVSLMVVVSNKRQQRGLRANYHVPPVAVEPIPPAIIGGEPGMYVVNPNSMSAAHSAAATSLVVDFGESYHDKTMHTHL